MVCAFSLRNRSAPRTSTSVPRIWCVLTIFSSKRASHHSGMHFSHKRCFHPQRNFSYKLVDLKTIILKKSRFYMVLQPGSLWGGNFEYLFETWARALCSWFGFLLICVLHVSCRRGVIATSTLALGNFFYLRPVHLELLRHGKKICPSPPVVFARKERERERKRSQRNAHTRIHRDIFVLLLTAWHTHMS